MRKFISMDFFQNLGKAFMLPVALLSALGLMLGIGSALMTPQLVEVIPFLGNGVIVFIAKFLAMTGAFGFQNLPALFAVAIPIALAKYEKGVAGFAGLVGFYMMHNSANFMLIQQNLLADKSSLINNGQTFILGVQTVDMGVLGGIIAGLIVYNLHRKYYKVQLPDALSFFSGARFVPIITAITMSLFGLALPFIWPPIAHLINSAGRSLVSTGIFAPFFFGMGERLLLPFGLHHILVALIRFTPAGGEMLVNGHMVYGALNIFYAQLADHTTGQFNPMATQFLSQGKMPTFLFGLPGAALAIYHTAKPENRSQIKGVLISGVVACVVAGITEPLEFLFLFTAPYLYVIHAVYTGLGFMMASLLHITIGNTDGNLIDLVVFGVLQGTKTKWYFVLPLGIVWFLLYYFTFKLVILKFNLKTLGREDEAVPDAVIGASDSAFSDKKTNDSVVLDKNSQANMIIEALGGRDNIISIDNCLTRLRIVLNDIDLIDEVKIKATKSLGIVKLNKQNLQVVYGVQVHLIKAELDKIL
ncbi:MAG: maltose/glucose-specific PTS transporter subunit IIBC [Burkholderiales bacterium]|nr:maltose/glucose-specific PTS transporter subunit IIBC [Burkholderiales bacterium]